MKLILNSIIVIIFCLAILGCNNNNAAIKSYTYKASFSKLKIVIDSVFAENTNLRFDSTREVTTSFANNVMDQMFSNYSSSHELFIYMKIFTDTANYSSYSFRFAEGKKNLKDTTTQLELLSCYDSKDKVAAKSNLTPLRKKKFIDLFENEFISKVNASLGFAK